MPAVHLPRHATRPAATRRGGWTAVLALALAAGLGPVPAASGSTAAPEPTVTLEDPDAPTAEELEAQREAAEKLREATAAQEQAVTEAREQLAQLGESAGAAMQAYQEALQEQDVAEAETAVQQQRLQTARDVLAGNRVDLGRWASQAYRDGGAMAEYESWMTVLESQTTDDLSQRLAMLRVVGRARGAVVDVAEQAEAVQRDAARRARQAAYAAEQAAERAAEAKAEADRLLEEQRAQLQVLDRLLAELREDADTAEARARQLALARAASEQRRLAAAAAGARAGANAVTGPVGDCVGGPVHRYPNGQIPLSALCPLGVPGHYLRADAAHAFGQLAAAYAAEFAEGLCITDSYRTVESQVQLFAAKPDLAAVPGTSDHGWGTAVDLCGGIESFGTPQHEWMRANAPLYGWFHPSWAQADGSRPEPWHWEYGG